MKIRKIKAHNNIRSELLIKKRKFWYTFNGCITSEGFPYKLYVSWKEAIGKLKNRSKL